MEACVTVSELSALLNRSPLSARQAAERAGELGVHLPYGTAASYWAGTHPQRPTEPTLQALSEVTGIPVTRLRAAVKVGIGELGPWKPPLEANRLTRPQREAVEQLIKAIVADAPRPARARGDDSRGTAAAAFQSDAQRIWEGDEP